MSIIILSGVSKLDGLVYGANGCKRGWIRKGWCKEPARWPSALPLEDEDGWKALVFKSMEEAETERQKFSLILNIDCLVVEDRAKVFVTV